MKEGWEYKKFEDALQKVKYTKKLQTSEFLSEGSIPIISQEEEYISGYWNKSEDSFKVDSAVVIFGDHSRVLKYVDFDFVLGADGVKILKPIDGLQAKYLYHYLKWYNVPSMGYSRHYKFLKEITLPIPSPSEQKQIVAELDLLSGAIEKQKSQLEELDELAQSIFYDMFGDPVTNEKGWDIIKWKDLFNTRLGKMLDRSKQSQDDKEYLYLANANVKWGYFDLSNLRSMTFNNDEIDEFKLLKGDLLICEGGESGRCAIWKEENSQIRFQKALHRARIKDVNSINQVYTQYYLFFIKKNGGLKDYISKATIEHLTGVMLNKVPVMCPPLALQQEFASKIEAIESMKAKVRQSLSEAETLFNSRMDYYFN